MNAKTAKSIVVAPPAVFEIADTAAAYDATRAGLGAVFLDELRAVRIRIEDHPESCPEVHPGLRRALVRRFPFGVIYRVTTSQIQVLAVLPTRADPLRSEARARTRAS